MDKIYQKIIPDVNKTVKRKFGGFTLIELLVVVLILGILAAMALPFYRRSVAITRISILLPLMRSISDAENRFYMVNNRYTRSFSALDISMPPGGELTASATGGEKVLYADFDCYVHISTVTAAQNSASSLYCSNKKVRHLSLEKYFHSANFICWAHKNNEEANIICQDISGRETHNATTDTGNGYSF